MRTTHEETANHKFCTSFLPLAAFLHCTGKLKFIGCEPEQNGRHAIFVFEDPDKEGQQIAVEFEAGAQCGAAALYDSIRRLRRLIDQTLGRRAGAR